METTSPFLFFLLTKGVLIKKTVCKYIERCVDVWGVRYYSVGPSVRHYVVLPKETFTNNRQTFWKVFLFGFPIFG